MPSSLHIGTINNPPHHIHVIPTTGVGCIRPHPPTPPSPSHTSPRYYKNVNTCNILTK